MFSKKALVWTQLIGIIMVSLLLLFFLFMYTGLYDDWKKEIALQECHGFLSTVEGNPIYFSNSLDTSFKNLSF